MHFDPRWDHWSRAVYMPTAGNAIVRVTQGKTHTNKYNHYGLELLHAENKCSVD